MTNWIHANGIASWLWLWLWLVYLVLLYCMAHPATLVPGQFARPCWAESGRPPRSNDHQRGTRSTPGIIDSPSILSSLKASTALFGLMKRFMPTDVPFLQPKPVLFQYSTLPGVTLHVGEGQTGSTGSQGTSSQAESSNNIAPPALFQVMQPPHRDPRFARSIRAYGGTDLHFEHDGYGSLPEEYCGSKDCLDRSICLVAERV